ncbi:MAG: 50S ribosomal protein L32 [Candidatus Babeliales bacterium]|nr:50S ribosomal protein L32 [Candidatus Babeliales bacterium]
MPVPKRKRSRARRDSRFANKGVEVKSFGKCKNCEAATLPHQACKECGHYKGIKVLTTKVERTAKRAQANQAKQSRASSQTPQEAASSDKE